jgi:hypothetical protein
MEGIPCASPGCQNVAFDHSPSYPFCGRCAGAHRMRDTGVEIKAVKAGTVLNMPTDDRAGFIRKPAPCDGLLISSNGWSEFVDADRLERELRRIGRAGQNGIPKRKEKRLS